MKNLLFFSEQIESKLFFSDVKFSSQPDFSIKIEFKNWDSGKYFFSRIWLFEMFCFRNLPERKIFKSKRDIWKFFISSFHCAGKVLLQNLNLFLRKISFQTLIFNEKVCYKVKKNCRLLLSNLIRNDFFSFVNSSSKSDFSIKIELKNWFLENIFSPI